MRRHERPGRTVRGAVTHHHTRGGRPPVARLPALALLLLLASPATRPVGAQRRPVTEQDLYALRWVADPQISPDGRQVAYVLVEVNAKRDGYETSIWVVDADSGSAPRRLTAGTHDGAP